MIDGTKELFLVTATIWQHGYQNEEEAAIITEVRLVEADTTSDARAKYEKYWERKSEPFGTWYELREVEVTDVIR